MFGLPFPNLTSPELQEQLRFINGIEVNCTHMFSIYVIVLTYDENVGKRPIMALN
jgi:hypothetical protein